MAKKEGVEECRLSIEIAHFHGQPLDCHHQSQYFAQLTKLLWQGSEAIGHSPETGLRRQILKAVFATCSSESLQTLAVQACCLEVSGLERVEEIPRGEESAKRWQNQPYVAWDQQQLPPDHMQIG